MLEHAQTVTQAISEVADDKVVRLYHKHFLEYVEQGKPFLSRDMEAGAYMSTLDEYALILAERLHLMYSDEPGYRGFNFTLGAVLLAFATQYVVPGSQR